MCFCGCVGGHLCLVDDVLDGAFSWEGQSCLFRQLHLVGSVLDSALMVFVLWAVMIAAMLFMQL